MNYNEFDNILFESKKYRNLIKKASQDLDRHLDTPFNRYDFIKYSNAIYPPKKELKNMLKSFMKKRQDLADKLRKDGPEATKAIRIWNNIEQDLARRRRKLQRRNRNIRLAFKNKI